MFQNLDSSSARRNKHKNNSQLLQNTLSDARKTAKEEDDIDIIHGSVRKSAPATLGGLRNAAISSTSSEGGMRMRIRVKSLIAHCFCSPFTVHRPSPIAHRSYAYSTVCITIMIMEVAKILLRGGVSRVWWSIMWGLRSNAQCEEAGEGSDGTQEITIFTLHNRT